jgi:hypothetical protein
MGKLWNSNFDDTLVRNEVIKFAKDVLGLKLISNEAIYKIDLLSIDDPELGVEVEHGKWNGNFWENDSYCRISNLEFSTLNMPIRKHKYWLEIVKDKPNPSHSKNIFVRSNKDFTQFIVVRPETVKDPDKLLKTRFQPNNSKEVEDWLSFRRENVETYNLIEGKFKIENTNELQ